MARWLPPNLDVKFGFLLLTPNEVKLLRERLANLRYSYEHTKVQEVRPRQEET